MTGPTGATRITRIKICGITRADDARAAAEAGAHAIGMVFAPNSPRCVTIEQAREIALGVPPFVSVVALVMDQSPDAVAQIARAVQPHLIQFHGSESAVDCRSAGVPYIKALGAGGLLPEEVVAQTAEFDDARALLIDGHRPGAAGGSGQRMALPVARAVREALAPAAVVLAGGLTPDTVGAAVRAVRPFAVDVSSGVEQSPGEKDHNRIQDFADAVRAADNRAHDIDQ